ncbi:MAG: hypothetical protein ABIS86_01100 [Streptosporangiaceae bacterium]
MSGNHRNVAGSRRKPKKNTGLIALAGVLVTALVVVAIAAAMFVLGSSGDQSDALSSRPTGTVPDEAEVKTNAPQGGGPPMTLTSTNGFKYSVSALDGQVADGKAYIDYVLTNVSGTEALLEEPGDLFVTKTKVTDQSKCMPQPGADANMCSVPNTTRIVAVVGASKPPVTREGDRYMPDGAAYKLRITTDNDVDASVTRKDLKLYVWDARFISDRYAHQVTFP